MKKQIIIENCFKCPYFDAAMITCKGTPSKDEGMTKTIIEIPLDFVYEEDIYERCPLEDAE